jgi:hypothetical protein
LRRSVRLGRWTLRDVYVNVNHADDNPAARGGAANSMKKNAIAARDAAR